MKILLGNKYFYVYRGAERYLMELFSLLRARGNHVIPFSMKHEKNLPSEYAEHFVDNIDFDLPRSLRTLPRDLKMGFKLIYSPEARRKISVLLDKTRPDIAHLHNIYYQLTPSILPEIKKRGMPILMTLHDHKLICPNHFLFSKGEICEKCMHWSYYHAVIRKCIKNSYSASLLDSLEMYVHRLWRVYERHVDLFVTPSAFLRSKLIEWGMEPDSLVHLPYCLHLDDYEPHSESNEGYFIYLGALSPEKGVDVLIRAMALAPEANLLILGSGEDADRLQRLAISCGCENIRFTGYLSGKNLEKIVRNAMCIIMPSICFDNSPLAIFEAMAYGKPVIASKVGGIPELVEDGLNGALFETGNSADLAEKIKEMIRRPDMAVEMGKRGRLKVEAELDPGTHYAALIEMYDSLLAKV